MMYTSGRLAQVLGISRHTIRRLVEEGMPFHACEGIYARKFDLEEVKAWLSVRKERKARERHERKVLRELQKAAQMPEFIETKDDGI